MSFPIFNFRSLAHVFSQMDTILHNISRLVIVSPTILSRHKSIEFTFSYIRKPNVYDNMIYCNLIMFGTCHTNNEDEALHHHDEYQYHEPLGQLVYDSFNRSMMLLPKLQRSPVKKVYLFIPNVCTIYYKMELVTYVYEDPH